MQITNVKGRKAISPVIATVILIAITLIAAIAIAGFVFGLFGSFTSGARVSGTATCPPGSTTGTCVVTLSNTGTAGTTVTAATIAYGGASGCTLTIGTSTAANVGSNPLSWPMTATCSSGTAVTPTAGETFEISVTLANGGIIPISGSFG
jgi:flagellin-like protein